MTPKVMEFVPAMGLLAICGLCGCDEEPVVLVDYTPRCVGFSFQYFEVSRNGPGWTLEGPVRPKDLPEYLDVEIGECSWGGLASVDVQDIELRSIPSPDAPTEEPTPLDFVLEPDVDLPVSLREPGENAPKELGSEPHDSHSDRGTDGHRFPQGSARGDDERGRGRGYLPSGPGSLQRGPGNRAHQRLVRRVRTPDPRRWQVRDEDRVLDCAVTETPSAERGWMAGAAERSLLPGMMSPPHIAASWMSLQSPPDLDSH